MSAEPGPSSKKPYWEQQAELESQEDPEFVPRDDEMEEDEDTSSDDEEMGDADVGDATTTDGGGGGEATDSGSQSKKARKDRAPIVVDVKRSIITRVSAKGEPLEPEAFVAGYSNQLAAILRNTVTINTENLKAEENKGYLIQLFRKLHARYAFPGDEEHKYNNDEYKGNPVNKYALKKMTKALSNWKARVKRLIVQKKLSYSELVKKEPLVKEEHYNEFKASISSALGEAKSKKGKELRALNIGTHHLGGGGYRAAKLKWEKEDAEARAKGLTPPFDDIQEEQAKNFVRARFAKPKGSSEYSSEPAGPFAMKVKDFMDIYDEECRSSSSQGSAPVAKWDTTFNRALNRVKNAEPQAPPSSAGRVVGFGGITWSEYYGTPERKGKKAESAEMKHLRE